MRTKTLTLFLGTLFFSAAAYANCYSISDQDKRNFCLAKTKQQSSYCYSIRESDSRNMCLAQVKSTRSYCYSIRNSDNKNECLALLKN